MRTLSEQLRGFWLIGRIGTSCIVFGMEKRNPRSRGHEIIPGEIYSKLGTGF